jgi:hypothetical protein
LPRRSFKQCSSCPALPICTLEGLYVPGISLPPKLPGDHSNLEHRHPLLHPLSAPIFSYASFTPIVFDLASLAITTTATSIISRQPRTLDRSSISHASRHHIYPRNYAFVPATHVSNTTHVTYAIRASTLYSTTNNASYVDIPTLFSNVLSAPHCPSPTLFYAPHCTIILAV